MADRTGVVIVAALAVPRGVLALTIDDGPHP